MQDSYQASHSVQQPVSIIIVNYNAGALLSRCVESVLAQSDEIIIVDNASADYSTDAVAFAWPRVRIIKNDQNLGFAAACNVAVRVASAPFLLFLNPDSSLKPGGLVQLLDTMLADKRVGMVGGLLTNPDGTEQGGGRRAVPTPWRSFVRAFGLHRFQNRWPKLFFDFHLHKQPLPDLPIEVEAISGACMLVRREAVADVGLWDEDYFLHCEDIDWCMRFRQKGWKILFVPSVRVTHALGGCSRGRPIFVEWHKHKGMMRFYRKFFRHQYPGVLMWLVTLGIWLRFGLVAVHLMAKRIRRALGLGHG